MTDSSSAAIAQTIAIGWLAGEQQQVVWGRLRVVGAAAQRRASAADIVDRCGTGL
jgi:hypothetical protein